MGGPAVPARLKVEAPGHRLYNLAASRSEDILDVIKLFEKDAPLTVVFVHGYTLSMASWTFQRRALADGYALVAAFWRTRVSVAG